MSSDPATAILQDPRFQGQPLTWEVTPEQYDTIRHAWLTHVAAEERLFVPCTDADWDEQMAVMLGDLLSLGAGAGQVPGRDYLLDPPPDRGGTRRALTHGAAGGRGRPERGHTTA